MLTTGFLHPECIFFLQLCVGYLGNYSNMKSRCAITMVVRIVGGTGLQLGLLVQLAKSKHLECGLGYDDLK